MHNRENVLKEWLENLIGQSQFTLAPLAGDASFRRYFRLQYNGLSRIVMDAPPETEAIEPFIQVGELLTGGNVLAPKIFAANKELGFLVLEDFNDQLLLHTLNSDNADFYYDKAISTLFKIQECTHAGWSLPEFDHAFMLQEMNLCKTWFLQAYLTLELNQQEENLLSDTLNWIAGQVQQQPQVLIHRDYHSRNLMLVGDNLGVIDFQDAMYGPVTYDLVSLLKDCYISWPRTQVLDWVTDFYHRSSLVRDCSLPEFIRAFDLCGLQRHLKVLGIFSRLYLRDNKPGYLPDLPLTLRYVSECTELYNELYPFSDFLKNRVYLP